MSAVQISLNAAPCSEFVEILVAPEMKELCDKRGLGSARH